MKKHAHYCVVLTFYMLHGLRDILVWEINISSVEARLLTSYYCISLSTALHFIGRSRSGIPGKIIGWSEIVAIWHWLSGIIVALSLASDFSSKTNWYLSNTFWMALLFTTIVASFVNFLVDLFSSRPLAAIQALPLSNYPSQKFSGRSSADLRVLSIDNCMFSIILNGNKFLPIPLPLWKLMVKVSSLLPITDWSYY